MSFCETCQKFTRSNWDPSMAHELHHCSHNECCFPQPTECATASSFLICVCSLFPVFFLVSLQSLVMQAWFLCFRIFCIFLTHVCVDVCFSFSIAYRLSVFDPVCLMPIFSYEVWHDFWITRKHWVYTLMSCPSMQHDKNKYLWYVLFFSTKLLLSIYTFCRTFKSHKIIL